jgi:hypothetical protein
MSGAANFCVALAVFIIIDRRVHCARERRGSKIREAEKEKKSRFLFSIFGHNGCACRRTLRPPPYIYIFISSRLARKNALGEI